MDINLAYACVGFGVLRALSGRRDDQPFVVPASLILREPDPVSYCIEAMQAERPDWRMPIGDETRDAIRHRLIDEAGRAGAARH